MGVSYVRVNKDWREGGLLFGIEGDLGVGRSDMGVLGMGRKIEDDGLVFSRVSGGRRIV